MNSGHCTTLAGIIKRVPATGCAEASRLIGAGMVVVAAAGNNGYLYFKTMSGNL
jgi:hypothetical protein